MTPQEAVGLIVNAWFGVEQEFCVGTEEVTESQRELDEILDVLDLRKYLP